MSEFSGDIPASVGTTETNGTHEAASGMVASGIGEVGLVYNREPAYNDCKMQGASTEHPTLNFQVKVSVEGQTDAMAAAVCQALEFTMGAFRRSVIVKQTDVQQPVFDVCWDIKPVELADTFVDQFKLGNLSAHLQALGSHYHTIEHEMRVKDAFMCTAYHFPDPEKYDVDTEMRAVTNKELQNIGACILGVEDIKDGHIVQCVHPVTAFVMNLAISKVCT
jgi:hypothetical protein